MKKILFIILIVCFSCAIPVQKPQITPVQIASTQKNIGIYLSIKSIGEIKELKTLTGHSEKVYSVAFSPDGKTLASAGSSDNSIILWDVATGSKLKTFTGHSNIVFSVAFSPDGKTLATGSGDNVDAANFVALILGATGSGDNSIILWDVATGSKLRALTGHSNSVISVAFSPDGKTLASGSWDNSVILWNVETGTKLKTLTGHSYIVLSVAFSPDGKTLASAGSSDDNSIILWDVATGSKLKTLTGHSETVFSVAFSPDGKTLASGSFDKNVMLWDVATGGKLKTLTGHSDWVKSVAFSPDGKTLASGSLDNSVMLWDAATGSQLKTLTGHSYIVLSVAFSPDGKTLASRGDKSVMLWDISGFDIAELFKKDEFESTDEFFKRVKSVEVPYSSKTSIGNYDADRGGFMSELNNIKVFVPASKEKARELAANKESVYINGTLKYFDKDTLELVNARLTLDASVAKLPVYAKRPAYVPKAVTVAEEKPVENIHDIPDFKASARDNDLAVVIGVEKYKDIQAKSDFSASDAGIMKDYLKALGFKERNIQFLTDANATRSGIEKAIEGWLPNRVKKGSTIFVYYSGHGAPDVAKGDGYIVPYDGDPNYLEQTGYSLKRLVEYLAKLDAKEVIVLLDSCFSGAGGRSVIAKGARPLVMKTENIALKDNIVMMTATRAEQVSMSSPEKGHGLFTYHFLKALKDGKKDMTDIYGQLKPLVEDEAKELNAEQSPAMTPAPEAVRGRFLLVR